MRIAVDKMPKNSQMCLFKKYYNQNTGWWTCGFFDTSVCSLDCGKKCPYLYEMERCEEKKMNCKQVCEDFKHCCGTCYWYNGEIGDGKQFCDALEVEVDEKFGCNKWIGKIGEEIYI